MRELSVVEIEEVSGGMIEDAMPYFTAMIAVGMAAYGTGWGAMLVGAAVTASPPAVGVMVALSFAGGMAWGKD